jgi:VanZ family protein
MAAIFFVSGDPDPGIPAGSDKLLHWLAYFGLAVVVIRAVAGGLPVRLDMRTAAIGMLITVGYAAFDEAHQLFVPGRSADINDLLADAAGAISGAVVCWAWGIISSASRDER